MFQLYKVEKSVFTFDDYAGLLAEIKRSEPKSVLEFGPGNSTFAWVEGGCREIITLEYNPKWMQRARLLLGPYRSRVKLLPFRNTAEISIPGLNERKFDLIFVDSPVGVEASIATKFPGQENCSRLNTLLWSLPRAPVVLLHDAKREGEQNALKRIPQGYKVEMIDTVKGMARITC